MYDSINVDFPTFLSPKKIILTYLPPFVDRLGRLFVEEVNVSDFDLGWSIFLLEYQINNGVILIVNNSMVAYLMFEKLMRFRYPPFE